MMFDASTYEAKRPTTAQYFGNATNLASLLAIAQPLDADLTSWSAVTRASGFDTFTATPTSANLRGLVTDESGTGALLFAGGNLGAATATSINGNTFTTGTYTLTGAAGKTLTFSNSLTLAGTDNKTLTLSNSLALAGTDGTTLTFPSTSATIARTDAAQTFTGTQTFSDGATLASTATSGLQLYNTVDQTTNYERLELLFSTNVARIRSASGGTGTNRNIAIVGAQNAALTIGTTGNPFSMDGVTSSSTSLIGFNLAVTSAATSGTITGGIRIAPVYNQASGNAANTDLLVTRTQTAVGSGTQLLADFQVGSTSMFSVSNLALGTWASAANAGSNFGSVLGSGKALRMGMDSLSSDTAFLRAANEGTAWLAMKYGALTHTFQTNGANSALILDSSQNATFGGQLAIGAAPSVVANYKISRISGTNGSVWEYERTAATARIWRTGVGIGGADEFEVYDLTSNIHPLKLAGATGDATFASSATINKRLITAPSALTYASPTSVDVTLASCYTVTTVNATGSVTFNATAGGTAGQHMWITITNDGTSGKTITFGTNFSSTGTVVGTTSKKATIEFLSDGTTWNEIARSLLIP